MEETKTTAEELQEEVKPTKTADSKTDKKKIKKLEAEIAELQKKLDES